MGKQQATKGAPQRGPSPSRAPSARGLGGKPGMIMDIQRLAGNRAAAAAVSRIDRAPGGGGGTKIGKLGVIDQDGTKGVGRPGLNLRTGPSGGASTRGRRLRHNDHLHVDKDMGNDWRFVQVTDGHLKGEYGYVSGKHVITDMPDPKATLHRIDKNQYAQALVRAHYKAKNMKTGEDQRFYTNVIHYVNKLARRNGVKRVKRPKRVKAWWSPTGWTIEQVDDTFLLAGQQIWLPGRRFARSLKGTVSSGSWQRDTWEKLKGYAETLAAVPAFIGGLVVGAVKSLWDLVKTIFVGAYNTIKSLGMNIVNAAKSIYNVLTTKKGRTDLLYALGDLANYYWYAPGKSFLTKWYRRGQLVGYATAEVITGKLLATIAIKGAKLAGKAAKIAAVVATKVPQVRTVLNAVKPMAQAAKGSKVVETGVAVVTKGKELGATAVTKGKELGGKVKNSKVGQAAGRGYGKAKELGGKVKNSKVGQVIGAPVRLYGKGKAKVGEGVTATAEALEKAAKRAAAAARRKARQGRIRRANRGLRKTVEKSGDSTKAAREVLKRTGNINKVRKDIAAGVFGKTDEAKKAAAAALDAARQKELDEVASIVAQSLKKENPDVKVEFYDSGSKGIHSDRDITIRVTKDPPVSKADARRMAALSIEAVQNAKQRLVKRRMRPEKDLDTNYYTDLHEGAFGGANKVETSAINRDQTVEALAEASVHMGKTQWRKYKRAQLRSVRPADPYDISAVEKAIHKEMTNRLREAERIAKGVRASSKARRAKKLQYAKRVLARALRSKKPVSDQQLRRLMSRVKMLEPDAYGATEAVKGVTKIQQPQQGVAAAALKKKRGEKLTADEERLLRESRDVVARAQGRRKGRAESADEMDNLVKEANASVGKLAQHSRRRRNTYEHAKDAAKYYERVRHAAEGMLARGTPGAGGNASLEIMISKLAGDLGPAELTRILREWATARGMGKASNQKILDAFVAQTRADAAALAQRMHTAALTKRYFNPDDANPPTI